MGVIEIGIIAAAGIFLLWLWRGGGQSKPVVATAECAAPRSSTQRCGPPRALGCLGVLFALLITTGMLIIGLRSQSFAVIGLALFVGIALLLFAGRWGRAASALGILALGVIVFLGISLMSIRAVRQGSRHAELEKLHWIDDWLDGPAAQFSPFHRARLERAQRVVETKKARELDEIRRRALFDGHGRHDSLPIPVEISFDQLKASDSQSGGAILNINLKPNALSSGNVSPDALAATLLAMVDLLAASEQAGETPPLSLSTLYRIDVQTRSGKAIPLSQIAHYRKESRKGGNERISLITVQANEKSKRPEGDQIRQAAKFLAGVELDRKSQQGTVNFQSAYSDSTLLIMVEPKPTDGIPVAAILAAATPEVPAAAVPPEAAPPAAAPPAAPAAPLPLGVTVPQRKLKTPVEGSVLDLLTAYQLLMWTLPESLGGAAEYQQATYELVPVAANSPSAAQVALAQAAEPVAAAAATPALVAPETPAFPAGVATVIRPAWLDGKAEYLDNQGDYYMRRSTGRLYQTADESHEAAAELLLEMTRDYVASLLGREAAAQVSIPIHTVLHDFVAATWDEEGPPPGLPDDDAWETHVLLKFDATDRQLVEQTWRRSVVDRNLRYAGASAGLLLALLGTVFGYLKVDTATRGYYSGRLKLATGAVVAAITTLGILLMAGTLRL